MPFPRVPRATSAIALVLCGAVLALAGCGGGGKPSSTASPSGSQSVVKPSASATPTPSTAKIPASSDLNVITVTGPYAKLPTVKVKTPWAVDKTRTRVLKPSTGPLITSGTSVRVNYLGVDARTGKTFDESFTKGQPVAFPLDKVVPGFRKGLVGQKQGSRVLVAMPGPDGYDASGGNAQAGINVGDTLLFVVDVVGVTLDGPSGAAVAPKPGLPTVTDVHGTPKVVVPKSSPPAALQVQPLIRGTGAKVAATDMVTVHYQWLTWSDGKVVEQNYGKPGDSTPLSGLIAGLRKGLVNQTVGSRMLVVVPPVDGYPNGNATPKINPGETLVFVVDILFTAAGQ